MTDLVNFDKATIQSDPFPHAMIDGVLDQPLFDAMHADFPADEVFLRNQLTDSTGGRSSRINLCRYNDDFKQHMQKSEAWRTFYEYANSPEYVRYVLDFFGDQIKAFGGQLDNEDWVFDASAEHPPLRFSEKVLNKTGARNAIDRLQSLLRQDALTVNFDIAYGGGGYGTEIHTDNRNKLSAMLIYFNDPGGKGGAFCVHEEITGKPLAQCERYPSEEKTRIEKMVQPKPNRGLILLNCNKSYHSAQAITENPVSRKFLYVSVNKRFVNNMWETVI